MCKIPNSRGSVYSQWSTVPGYSQLKSVNNNNLGDFPSIDFREKEKLRKQDTQEANVSEKVENSKMKALNKLEPCGSITTIEDDYSFVSSYQSSTVCSSEYEIEIKGAEDQSSKTSNAASDIQSGIKTDFVDDVD